MSDSVFLVALNALFFDGSVFQNLRNEEQVAIIQASTVLSLAEKVCGIVCVCVCVCWVGGFGGLRAHDLSCSNSLLSCSGYSRLRGQRRPSTRRWWTWSWRWWVIYCHSGSILFKHSTAHSGTVRDERKEGRMTEEALREQHVFMDVG